MQYDSDKKFLSTAPEFHFSIPTLSCPVLFSRLPQRGSLQLRQIQRQTPLAFPSWLSVTFMDCLTVSYWPSRLARKKTLVSLPSVLLLSELQLNKIIFHSVFLLQLSNTADFVERNVLTPLLLYALQFLDNFLEVFRLMHPTTAALRL